MQRWTVSDMFTSIEATRSGYGFALLPEDKIRNELRAGELRTECFHPFSAISQTSFRRTALLGHPQHDRGESMRAHRRNRTR